MSSDAAAMSPDAPLFLTHAIVRTDSLATIAVKYGVTIRDVKRANGGVITDATLHARASVRIPRTALAEGAPLPGGGGLSGAARPKTGSAALEEMREYYGTRAAAETAAEDGAHLSTSRHEFANGTQVASKLKRVGSERSAALNEAPSSMRGADESPTSRESGTVGGGGGVSAMTFQSRDRALMSPLTTRTASGTVLPLNSAVSSTSGGGVLVPPFFPSVGPRPGANVVAGFFDRARRGVRSLAGDEKTLSSAAGRSGGKALRSASLGGSERKGKGD
jgi:LysM repeat protein